MSEYDFELERIACEIKSSNARRVVIQLPEGLKSFAFEIMDHLESRTGAQILVLADPTYGACDLKLGDVGRLDADMLIHFGHTSMPPEI
jgi:2-(3-amino-3-carboxypropyl)histidine synthase